jgi:hypothetical protein
MRHRFHRPPHVAARAAGTIEGSNFFAAAAVISLTGRGPLGTTAACRHMWRRRFMSAEAREQV